ncbi:DUF1389 domain-containing protein [Chlamydiifrater volucris]|uniref:DUF1389 domain-containing protein n=1 Tax=Chlamydiifrater volucris TaxID=2681470 RepID=UPI001BD0ED1F|nr:DUF1389 domain-containing protein [Chlamydiifrater volucris]
MSSANTLSAGGSTRLPQKTTNGEQSASSSLPEWLKVSRSSIVSRSIIALVTNIMVVSGVLLMVGACLGWLNVASVAFFAVMLVAGAITLFKAQDEVYDVFLEEKPEEKKEERLVHRQLECFREFSRGFKNVLAAHYSENLNKFLTEENLSLLEIREFLSKISSSGVKEFFLSEEDFSQSSVEEGLARFSSNVKKTFSPQLSEKILSFWPLLSRPWLSKDENLAAYSDTLENLLKERCPLVWLSEFLSKCHKGHWLSGYRAVFQKRVPMSLKSSSAYCVSRLGLLESSSTIFSLKWWVLSKVVTKEEYEKMVEDYGCGFKEEFLSKVQQCQEVFQKFIEENKDLQIDVPTFKEFQVLCEHKISPEAFLSLSELSKERLDFFSRLTDHNGSNLLAKWLRSFGDCLHDVNSESFSCFYPYTVYKYFASSVMCLTEEEILENLDDDKAFSRMLSELSGLLIEIEEISDSWYVTNRVLDAS